GTNAVASMVVFEDGLERKGEYRRFAMRGEYGDDDTGWIHEAVRRRFARYLDERVDSGDLAGPDVGPPGAGGDPDGAGGVRGGREDAAGGRGAPSGAGGDRGGVGARPIDPVTGRPRKFAYPPNLVVVDGGAPQVAAAYRALVELGIEDVGLVG